MKLFEQTLKRKNLKNIRALEQCLELHNLFCKKKKSSCSGRKKLELKLKKEKGKLIK